MVIIQKINVTKFWLHNRYKSREKIKIKIYILGYLLKVIIRLWQFENSKSAEFGSFSP